jgi:hypothetical protein
MIPELLRWWKQPYSLSKIFEFCFLLAISILQSEASYMCTPTILLFLISTTENPADISRLLFTTTTHQRKTVFELCVRKWYAYAAAAKESPQQERKNEKIHSVFFNRSQLLFFFSSPYYENDSVFKAAVHGELFPRTLAKVLLRQSQNDLFLNLLMISYWPYRILHCWKSNYLLTLGV